MSRGKTFEREVVNSMKTWWPKAFTQRFTDGMYSQGASVKTPPDIICIRSDDGRPLLVECKARKGKSIPFNALSEHQSAHLRDFPGLGVVAVLLYNGERGKNRMARAWMVPIGLWDALQATSKRESIPIKELDSRLPDMEMRWLGNGKWEKPSSWK